MRKLTLLVDYVEDNRTSMSIYSDNILNAMKASIQPYKYELVPYTPNFPTWVANLRLSIGMQMRYARYISYPAQVDSLSSDLWHIVDQSYAHLLYSIDSSQAVVTVHDLIPILAWEGAITGLSYPHPPLLYKRSIAALKKAGAIVAVSESTKKDLVKYCDVREEKIHVVYNPVGGQFRAMSNKAELRKLLALPIHDVALILITGSQSYKNHINSIKAIRVLESVIKRPVQLVWLAGLYCEFGDDINKELSQLGLPPILLGYLNQLDLVNLYNAVDCLMFPSWYEGFGWPPLEAMSCGLPVIASNSSSLPEVVGDAALMVNPADIQGLAEALEKILEDEVIRQHYILQGFENVKRFTFDKFALKMNAVYDSLHM